MDTYLPDIMPYVPGCPEILVERTVLRAAIMFCSDSFAYRKTQEGTITAETEDETTTVTLVPDTDAEVIAIPLYKRDDIESNDFERTGNSFVVPAWAQDSTYEIVMAQQLPSDATALPASFTAIPYLGTRQAVRQLTLHLLHDMKGQVWYDPKQGDIDLTRYNKELGLVRAEIWRPNAMTEMRVANRGFV